MEVEIIGREAGLIDAKIKDLLEEKFHSILCQSEASLKLFGPIPPIWNGGRGTPSVISSFSVSKKERKTIMSRWGSYIRQVGMTRVSAPKIVAENAYVLDPATNWFNSGVPSRLWRRELYVKIPRDLAMKILVLGSLS